MYANMYVYVHISSSAYKLLVLKIYSIYNVNSRLTVELQSTYQITSKTWKFENFEKRFIIRTL